MRTLVLTNDFPPRGGGIETYVHEILRRQDPTSIAVLAAAGDSRSDGASRDEVIAYDRSVGFHVARLRAGMWPTRQVADTAVAVARELDCGQVWLPSSAPHGLIVPLLQRRGLAVKVATTHGAEAGMARYPGGRRIVRAAAEAEVLTYLGAWTRSQVERGLPGRREERRWARLAPGVDVDLWAPTAERQARVRALRSRLGLVDRPVVACVSRLVPRKGQDRLIAAWPRVLRRIPDAVLLLVGAGSYAKRLQAQASSLGDRVVFTGRVPYEELPDYTALADVATLPARRRLGGLDVEGLGIVLLEAAALGIPTIACDTGGVPDALVPGTTGLLLSQADGESEFVAQLADALVDLLSDPARREQMGRAGRAWVQENWTWDVPAATLAGLLAAGT